MTGCAIWPERVGLWGRRATSFGRFMGFDKGRKGDRGGRGRDKRDDFFGGEQPHGDFGFQERPAYGGGGRGGYGGGGGVRPAGRRRGEGGRAQRRRRRRGGRRWTAAPADRREGQRHGQVLQRDEGLRLHPAR